MSLQTNLASAITRMENTNPAYNNPGAIWDMSTNAIRRYSTFEEGYQALLNTINSKISRGHTLTSFFREYAPLGHGDNNPDLYASTVGGWLNLPTDVPLVDLQGIDNPLNPVITSTATTSIASLLPTELFQATTLWPGVAVPNWLLLGVGTGVLIWILTD